MRRVLVFTGLVLAVVVVAAAVNIIVPALGRSTSDGLSSGTARSNWPKTEPVVIYVAADTSGSPEIVYAWVKNVGAAEITGIHSADLFVKTGTTSDRLTHDASCGTDCWSYSIEGDTVWRPGATIKITIKLSNLAAGDYLVRFVTSNGVAAEKEFTV